MNETRKEIELYILSYRRLESGEWDCSGIGIGYPNEAAARKEIKKLMRKGETYDVKLWERTLTKTDGWWTETEKRLIDEHSFTRY